MKRVQVFLLPTLLLAISITSCVSTPKKRPVYWKSEFHEIKVRYQAPWGIVRIGLDTKEEIQKFFIDQSNGCSYVIHIEPDVPISEVPDSAYEEVVIDEILESHKGNSLVKREKSIEYHGLTFNKLSFDIKSGKWGPRRQEFYIRRDGKNFIRIIRMYINSEPYTQQMEDFEKNVWLFEDMGPRS
ncbi:MAG: hypothetical protein MRZ79_22705 [Bacteroidia bacterium]|nr:hypothetical protein [Bacteroidia bacterium]